MFLIYYSCPLLEDGTPDFDNCTPHPELSPDILESDWLDWEGTGEMIGPEMFTNGEEVRFGLVHQEAAAALEPAA